MRFMIIPVLTVSLLLLVAVACTEPAASTPAPPASGPSTLVGEAPAESESHERTAPPTLTQPPPVVVPTPAPDSGVITGRILAEGDGEPVAATAVWLAWIYWFDKAYTDGTFNLDPSTSPNALTDSEGRFAIGGVEPRDYAIVIGDPMGSSYILSESDGSARVFTITAGQTLDTGNQFVDLRRPAETPESYPPVVLLYP